MHLALGDLEVDDPSANNSGRHHRNRTTFGAELEANWEIYAWLARSLPTEARLLTLNAFVSASAAGIVSPRSGRDLQVFQHGYPTWVYRDALRFLHQDDLADMGISHLHVTDPLAAALAPSARRLLDDPDHFRLLVDMRTVSGIRHRVFEVLPSAGTTEVVPSSYRFLRPGSYPRMRLFPMLGTLTWTERRELYTAFADHDHIGSSYPLGHDRGTRIPRIETLVDLPDGGVVVLGRSSESHRARRITGFGDMDRLRDAGLRSCSGLVARVAHRARPRPLARAAAADLWSRPADGLLDLRLLGEPGTTVVAGLTELTLTGLPQEIQLSVTDCGALVRGVAPDSSVEVINVKWFGDSAVELTYKTSGTGAVGTRLLYKDDEPGLEVVERGLPWSFDGDGALFRLVSEAQRIRLAHLFDPVLAIHTSIVKPLPHQITAVYDSMLTRQPLRFLLADDPGAGAAGS